MRNYAGSALMLFVTIAAAVGSYTINLKVSAERAAVERLRRNIVADAGDMRDLQAELRTRARLPEMQRWNDNVLQMSAPSAGQYLRSPVQLASFGANPEAAPAAVPALRYAVTVPVPAAAVAAVVQTAYHPPATASVRPSPPAASRPAAPETARIIRASYTPGRPAQLRPAIDLASEIGASLDAGPAATPVNLLPEGGQ